MSIKNKAIEIIARDSQKKRLSCKDVCQANNLFEDQESPNYFNNNIDIKKIIKDITYILNKNELKLLENYFWKDLSYAEIGKLEEYNCTRQGIQLRVKVITDKLLKVSKLKNYSEEMMVGELS